MNRIILAWLLSVIIITPYVAKPVHVLLNESCGSICSHAEENHKHSHKHDCDTCPVCQFVLSSFTEVDINKPENGLMQTCSRIIHASYNNKKYNSITHLNYLRAPPLL